MNPLEKKQEELIRVLYSQVADLSMMSKIELGDDVISKLREIESEIAQIKETYIPLYLK